jgi:hypothetical protein
MNPLILRFIAWVTLMALFRWKWRWVFLFWSKVGDLLKSLLKIYVELCRFTASQINKAFGHRNLLNWWHVSFSIPATVVFWVML